MIPVEVTFREGGKWHEGAFSVDFLRSMITSTEYLNQVPRFAAIKLPGGVIFDVVLKEFGESAWRTE